MSLCPMSRPTFSYFYRAIRDGRNVWITSDGVAFLVGTCVLVKAQRGWGRIH